MNDDGSTRENVKILAMNRWALIIAHFFLFSATLFYIPLLQQAYLLASHMGKIVIQQTAMKVSWGYSSSAILLQEIYYI